MMEYEGAVSDENVNGLWDGRDHGAKQGVTCWSITFAGRDRQGTKIVSPGFNSKSISGALPLKTEE